jgi:hypothetical protein
MSDAVEAQGDFTIERIASAGSELGKDDAQASRDSDKREPKEKQTTAAARESDFPDRIRRKYYVISERRQKQGAPLDARFYADERGEYLVFKVVEDRLVTRLAAAEVIRDMIAVAEHRNWQAIHIRGALEFRREAWREASSRGMEVKGYEPTEIDQQALAARREAHERVNGRQRRTRNVVRREAKSDRFEARVDHDRRLDNVTPIDAAEGKARFNGLQAPQSRWRKTAAKFRTAETRAVVRDPELVGAQSQLVIIEKALQQAFPDDRQARQRILEAAKERLVHHLEKGRSFERAMLREPASERSPGQNHNRPDARRVTEGIQERSQQRER